MDQRVMPVRALGFGRADLVVAAPQSWIDVETMADVADVAHSFLARTGQRLRVATKYDVQTRAFFAAKGVDEYRIVESGGATEGAPAAGYAELVVDITTTGATLAANNLKIIRDGVILKSQAQLAASLGCTWNRAGLDILRQLLSVLEVRARGRELYSLRWPVEQQQAAEAAVASFLAKGAALRVIIDLTAAEVAGEDTLTHLIQMLRAVALIGAEGAVCGLSPSLAQRMVEDELGFDGVPVYRNLGEALRSNKGV